MGKGIISVVGILVSLGIFFFYTKQTYDSTASTRTQLAEYDQALVKAAELQQRKEALLQKYNQFTPEELDRLQKFLPDHVDNVRLILDLDNIATRRGMALQNVAVEKPGGPNDISQTAIGTISSSKQKYDTLTTSFTTQGTYASIQQLLMDLETSLRLIDIVSFDMAPTGLKLGSEPQYTFKITMRTYWLK